MIKKTLLAFCCILFRTLSFAQAPVTFDSTGLKIITISHADSVRGTKTENENYQRILGAVVIIHEGITMTCDSAHLYSEKNMVEAYSNVNIAKSNGTNAHSDYMKYTGNNNTAFMKGSVQIIDGGNTLFTEELNYNLKTKIGKYTNGGTLQTEETTVSSNEGTYNAFSKQSYFKKDVVITNPKYTIESKELTYNTNNKVIKFLDETTVISEHSTVHTTAGTYDSKNERAVFTKRTTVESEDQIIIGDKLEYNDKTGYGKAVGNVVIIDTKNDSKITSTSAEYNKITGYGKAIGNVVITREAGKNIITADQTEYNKKTGYAKATGKVVLVDTAEHSTLLSGMVQFNENSKFMLATLHPKLITLADKDSLFMRSDTMMNIRFKDKDLLKRIEQTTYDNKKKIVTSMYNLLLADSTYKSEEGVEEPKLIIANHNVRLYSDSMQLVCDSLSYSQQDSSFRLYKNPVMWSKAQQSNADTIFIHTIDNKLSEVNLKGSSLLVSETGYKTMFDQVSGNYIDAYFKLNELYFVHVNQNAETVYYSKDDEGAFLGVNKTEGAELDLFFKEKAVNHIVMKEDVKGVMTPIDKMNDTDKFLGTYKTFPERKPKSRESILED